MWSKVHLHLIKDQLRLRLFNLIVSVISEFCGNGIPLLLKGMGEEQ